ncbi:transposase [Escherichia coli]|nr:transposase [Escherichia coli]
MYSLIGSCKLNGIEPETCKRKLTAVCSHQTRIGNLDAHLI